MDTASPSNKVLPFNNNSKPSSSPELAVKLRLRVRLILICLTGALIVLCASQTLTDFTKCLEAADVQSCSWFLEQLKAVSQTFSDVLTEAHRTDTVASVPVCCFKILDPYHGVPSRPTSIANDEMNPSLFTDHNCAIIASLGEKQAVSLRVGERSR